MTATIYQAKTWQGITFYEVIDEEDLN